MAIETQIEIAAAPSKVREILLDFPNYSKWHTTFLKTIEPEKQSTSESSNPVLPGDKIRVDADGMKFVATITANSADLLQWQGPPVYGVAGLHGFHIKSANDEGSSTIFKQTEEFTGLISFLMTPSFLGRGLISHFKQFNSDLKAFAEASSK
jgi:hypothetical protein